MVLDLAVEVRGLVRGWGGLPQDSREVSSRARGGEGGRKEVWRKEVLGEEREMEVLRGCTESRGRWATPFTPLLKSVG